MAAVELAAEIGRALDLEATGGGVCDSSLGPPFSGFQTAGAEPERIPAETHASPDHGHGRDQGDSHDEPAERRQGAQDQARAHGKALRSSSKCGPSRRVGQSPPQTMAVPCRAAAALKAAAMRG